MDSRLIARLRSVVLAAPVALLAACAAVSSAADRPAAPRHLLDPLDAAEIHAAAATIRAARGGGASLRFSSIALEEPTKESLAAHAAGGPAPRRIALAVLRDVAAHATAEARVDVSARTLLAWTDRPGAQVPLLDEEYEAVRELLAADEGWRAAIARRGIPDLAAVHVDVWAPGVPPPSAPPGARIARGIAFHAADAKNPYGSPIEGLVAVVDLDARRVVEVHDAGPRPLAPRSQDLDAAHLAPLRLPAAPLRITQPDGPGFRIDGHRVRWEGWSFRVSLHPREGLVLHDVAWEGTAGDARRGRSILHRASLSEMVVPYGDPDPVWSWRSAFDEGEYLLGRIANELEPGRDAPENAVFLDAVVAGEDGAARTIANAITLWERDGGLLWKHLEERTGIAETRRARDLVVGFAVTVGNYDYGFSWIFHQDGSLAFDTTLTGILLAKGADGARCEACDDLVAGRDASTGPRVDRFGTVVSPGIVAPNHQHFVALRLDFDVDGVENSVAELDVAAVPAPAGSPPGNGFAEEETLLRTERAARRDLDLARHRRWKVFHPGKRNAIGHLPGYMLVPGENGVAYFAPGSEQRRRAGFVDHHLWVTRHREGELYAAGDYPHQRLTPDGLPVWSEDDEPLVATDVVLWYVLGVTHIPRPEEWPIMPAAHAGLRLVPMGFFERSPALSVPDAR